MNKQKFLADLREALAGLPEQDLEDRLGFYSEMIDDRMEEGLSEEEAVLSVGSVQDIVSEVLKDMPLGKIARERLKPLRRIGPWELALLILGSPIWLSLVISAAAVIFSLYISLWAVIVSLWAVFVSLAGCSAAGIVAFIVFTGTGNRASGLEMLAAGMVCAGLTIFGFYGCKAITKGTLLLTKKMAIGTKRLLIRKETVQ